MSKKNDGIARGKGGKFESFEARGKEPMADKPVSVKLPASLDDVLRGLPDRSQWIRRAIEEAAIAQGLWEREGDGF